MKDKLIRLENGECICVLDEFNYNEKKYVLSVSCDIDKEEMLNKYKIYELSLNNDTLTLDTINNKDVLDYVTKKFLDNIKNI